MTDPEPAAPGPAADRPLFAPERTLAADRAAAGTLAGARHPAFRLLAVTLLVAAALAHNALIHWLPITERVLWYAAGMIAYGALSWAVLRRRHRSDPPGDAGALFLLLDLLPLAATVWISGATDSWLFWIALLHPADQAPRGSGRTAAAAALAPLGYAGAVAVAVGVDGHSVAGWQPEAGKLALLFLGGIYLTLVARRAERARGRVEEMVREIRERATDLLEDYRHLERTAEEAGRDRSRFLLRVVDEVRTLGRELLRSAQLVEAAADDRERDRHTRRLLDRGRHLLDIVNEVVDLARVQSGSLARELRPVAVRPALDDVLEQAVGAAQRRGIALPSRAPLDRDLWVLANDRKLRQVFANLISNAIKYNRPGGRIELECAVAEERLRVTVRDTGPGIPPDRVDAAFAPFDRLGAEDGGVPGTGLGLPLARSLVEAMHGELGLISRPGTGSTFWFELRLADPPEEGGAAAGAPTTSDAAVEAPTPAAEAAPADSPADEGRAEEGADEGADERASAMDAGAEGRQANAASHARGTGEVGARAVAPPTAPPLLLYIDANPENATALGRILGERPDVEMLWTPLGLQGVEAAAARRPSLVLLHVRLLDVSANEAFRLLAKQLPADGVPVVAVAPYGEPSEELEALLSAGARGPLTTPYDEDEILALLDEVATPDA